MGHKMRNSFRPASMRNFSNYILERYILIDDVTLTDESKDRFVKEINERLWLAIQEANALVKGRVLPFVVVRRVVKDNTKLRIIINDFDCEKGVNEYEEIKELDIKKLTHLINFKDLPPQRRVMSSDDILQSNARIIVDKKDQVSAAVDIFLDIAMFNSYSYLKEMALEDKKIFSKRKMAFYEKTKRANDNIYYLIDENNPPAYFSFAFAARTDYRKIDYNKYIGIWNKFLNDQYATLTNTNMPPEKQMLYYRDKDNIENKYFSSDFWRNYSGDYLLLRINRTPDTSERSDEITNYFGIEEMRIGATKLVPLGMYFDAFVKKQLDELYISAFKVVC